MKKRFLLISSILVINMYGMRAPSLLELPLDIHGTITTFLVQDTTLSKALSNFKNLALTNTFYKALIGNASLKRMIMRTILQMKYLLSLNDYKVLAQRLDSLEESWFIEQYQLDTALTEAAVLRYGIYLIGIVTDAHFKEILLLLDKGANPNLLLGEVVMVKDRYNFTLYRKTLLTSAAYRGLHKHCIELIKRGALVNTKTESRYDTPLILACIRYRPTTFEVVQVLIAAGANVTLKNKEGRNALWYAKHPDTNTKDWRKISNFLKKQQSANTNVLQKALNFLKR